MDFVACASHLTALNNTICWVDPEVVATKMASVLEQNNKTITNATHRWYTEYLYDRR